MIHALDPKDEEKEIIERQNIQIELAKAQALEAQKDSRKALSYSMTALILTAIFGLSDWIVMYREWSDKTVEQSIKPITEVLNEQSLQLQKTNQLLDSLVYLQGKLSKQLLNKTYPEKKIKSLKTK